MNKYNTAIICLGLVLLAGMLNGVMDTLSFHYSTSVFPQDESDTFLWQDRQFWDPSQSWKNKYTDYPVDRSPAFIGSTTWLVALTDGWHLAKMLMKLCYHLAIIIPLIRIYGLRRHWIVLVLFPLHILVGAAFTLLYGHWLVNKDRK